MQWLAFVILFRPAVGSYFAHDLTGSLELYGIIWNYMELIELSMVAEVRILAE
jgi:hypothetical protein